MKDGLPATASLGGRCCGCGACAAACRAGALRMAPDACGFLHPEIDAAACTGCGACDRVCPALSAGTNPADGLEGAFWAKAKDPDLLERSSSGGVFGLLARDALRRGGVVCGAAWDQGCASVSHRVVDDEEDLDAIMRSKYVQSSVGPEAYRSVRAALSAGRPTLFCGTACQVAGLRGFLGRLADEGPLLAVDVICHGAPSPGLWRRWLESQGWAGVEGVNFRSKATGWSSFSLLYEYRREKDGQTQALSHVFRGDWYMRAFLANASLRGSCLACPAKRSCGSDLTLGDFWGIERAHPDVDASMGVSAVLCSTARGLEAFRRVAGEAESGESSLEKVLAGNPALASSARPFPGREAFLAAVAQGAPVPEMQRRWSFEPTAVQRVVGLARRALGKAKRLVKGRL